MPSRRTRTRTVATVSALVVVAGGATLLPGRAPEAAASSLQPYAGCDELLKSYREALDDERGAGRFPFLRALGRDSATSSESAAGAAPEAAAVGSAVAPGGTGTNLQERGVDEPDSAKTAAGLILALSERRLQVLRTGAEPEPLGSLDLGGSAYGAELLVQGDRVLVVVPGTGGVAEPLPSIAPGGRGDRSEPSPVLPPTEGTRLLLVDLAEPASPRLVETLDLEGRYVSARLSGGAVRLVTSSTPTLDEPARRSEDRTLEERRTSPEDATVEQVLPSSVRRTATGRVLEQGPAVECGDVQHAGTADQGAGTLLVTTLDLTQDLAAVDRTAVTTDGDLVYASSDRLYVATSRWGSARRPDAEVSTQVHAFDTTSPRVARYAGSATVRGHVYGRWAFSSHEGHLRVATTGEPDSDATSSSSGARRPARTSSSVTVLQERPDSLVQTGRLDGLGPDERIYAVRFFGDLAAVVTFRETDPLYVLDLADPTAPALLGELKVPGFSTYLHPVGDDRLLAVGQDADDRGRVLGLQVSLFDLSDRTRPTQLDRLSLGSSTTPASQDSRAFGYDPGRRLALLPLTRDDLRTGAQRSEALGIRVTEQGTLEQAGRLPVPSTGDVERVLFDDDHLYAVSRRGVVAGGLEDFAPTGSVAFRSR